ETGKTTYSWDENNATVIPASYYYTSAEGYSQGSVPALYSQNHWNVYYVFRAGGEDFVVAPATTDTEPLNKRMLVVHNYHKMADIVDTKYNVALAAGSDIYAKALKPGAMIYLADDADIAAFVNYINAGNTGESMNFYLQNDLTLPAAITKAFAGTLHGNGYSITLPSAGGSLFSDMLTGKVYNLGVPNGTIASTGTITNCFTSADGEEDLRYGKKAYALSHYFTTENDEASRDNYVHTLYANNDGMGGDWRYARIADIYENARFLRTAAPNYGNMQTSHNTEHADNYELIPHDCIFFGQTLTPTAEKKYPEHIDEAYSVNKWVETNRVYRTAGYYGSSDNDGFHYNKVAWAMQPTLTAIDFTAANLDTYAEGNFYGKTDDRPESLTSFNSDHNGTESPYSNAKTGKVSQNLLVYNSDNGNAVFKFKDISTTKESDVQYHNILLNGSSTYSTNYLHLVDKQDFWAPIEFNVTNRAWYERLPQAYRNVKSLGYDNGSAWEGIVLPFTATKVTASFNGDISHFYEKDDINHEYWLRGLTGVNSGTATFMHPATDVANGFTNPAQSASDYLYQNTYFASLTNYDTSDKFGKHYDDAAKSGVTFTDYIPLTASVPYIVAFPGNDFYEFSMEGDKNYDTSETSSHDKSGNGQWATFETASTTILETAEVIKTTVNGYDHIGTFLHKEWEKDNAYGINTDGSAFAKDITFAVPFRTYMTAYSSPARERQIFISDDTDDDRIEVEYDEQKSPEEELSGKSLKIYVKGNELIIESNYATTLRTYTPSGQYIRLLNVNEGINTYHNFHSGIYIIGNKKVIFR
ncbi:MAG: hypothetical protein KBT33_06775, partial [Prevotellaceae bacterium]|nr:hypothetical protein [Candidatus Minthosoma equi]